VTFSIECHVFHTEGTVTDFAIETAGLTRHFAEVHAVDDLSLHVPRGSVYAFLGPNGAGKTTTIRMLLGLTRPDHGDIRVFGTPLTRATRQTCLRRIGALAETPSVYPHLTGIENLQVTQRLLALDPSSIKRVLRIVGLESAAHLCWLHQLSAETIERSPLQ
jgi:ABC-type multidrug transport system ATPase subunit